MIKGALSVAIAVVLAGCASAGEGEASDATAPTTAAAASVSSETTVASTATTATTEAPPPDYDAIYRRLHDEAVAFIMDPLEKPSDAINCTRNVDCIVVANQARDGQFWRGMDAGNLTITSVEVLEEVSPNLVYLKVSAEAADVIELVDDDGTVVESIGVPSGAARRVSLIKIDDEWILLSAMDGRRWTRQAYEADDSFSLVDPLDEPMTPTGEQGTTEDGVSWRTLVTDDRFCVEAEQPDIGKMVRCLSAPQYSDLSPALNFVMAFSGDHPNQSYVVVWFGLKVDEGVLVLEDGQEQIDTLFPVDTSAVFDDEVELAIGVSMVDQRPGAVFGRGPGTESDSFSFDWPVPSEEP